MLLLILITNVSRFCIEYLSPAESYSEEVPNSTVDYWPIDILTELIIFATFVATDAGFCLLVTRLCCSVGNRTQLIDQRLPN